MRILTKTSLYYLLVSFVVFLLGGIGYYLILQGEIYDEVDDQLFTDKENILAFIRRTNTLPHVTSGVTETILVKEVTNATPVLESLTDTLIYSSYDEESIPYRRLTFTAYQNNRVYQYTIMKSVMDFDDLFESTVFAMGWTFLMLLVGLGAVNYSINKYTWRNFYNTLQKIKRYSLSQYGPLQLKPSNTTEFQELNSVLQAMTNKIHADYLNLKEFTENVSHEIQTPLAIVNSKLELFMQSATLTTDQAKLLEEMHHSVTRLARLNKSLILLTRIENREFKENEDVALHELLAQQTEQLQELIDMHGLQLEQSITKPVFVHMNRGLAEVLVSNLLINAIQHNQPNGIIKVALTKAKLCIQNTGEAIQNSPDNMFGRFVSGSNKSGSLGIGLALVNKICSVYSLQPSYTYQDGMHTLCINFSNKNR
ncbi:HAMP domain-containing histidine kinase [Pontibacter sp. KCTC 32443]|uniref:sensor histidine kinase n=1 Tax=Pontibacter TaxID=323449 RepID=UPI00164E5431|nr:MULTISPECIES: HAMP domain-containing sensor histidine kinase [Pontibacter]MBC5773297.1 HAMP domain-containing histidine kinase [Pontibacter sp. KCTC 32443]